MRILVLGAGVIGVTTAWHLARQGHEVTVLERAHDVATGGASFANAGQLSYGYAFPWAAPGVPLKALKWMFDASAPFKLYPTTQLAQWRWLALMLRNCTAERFEQNKARMLALSHYSREAMHELLQATGPLEFSYGRKGTLQVFRTLEQLSAAQRDLEMLQRAGVAASMCFNADAVFEHEPALARARVPVAGGLRLPDDETGDCRAFVEHLARCCVKMGVTFELGTTVLGIERFSDGVVSGVRTSAGLRTADEYVLALGSWSVGLARELRLDLPVYPVKGYSLTYAIEAPDEAPASTVMDETYKVAITRLGGQLRVGGTAELSGFNDLLRDARRATLERSATDLFPRAGAVATARFWTGLRPSTPDGMPYVGSTPVRNLWVNCGHGTLGWTMAAGSAKALALAIERRADAQTRRLLRPLG